MDDDDPVWYVSYGSNLSEARFTCYLAGGTPEGSTTRNSGARDPRPARDRRPVWLDGAVWFGGRADGWGGGGVAFLDPTAPGRAAGRAYLVTAAQFADVAAQENGLAPGDGPDLDAVLAAGTAPQHQHDWRPKGWYGRLLHVGDLDGHPMLTFTVADPARVAPAAPAADYLGVVGRGLVEAHGWTTAATAAWLAALDGCRGVWTSATVAATLTRRS